MNSDREKPLKTPKTFYCESCNFKCSNKKDYSRHLSTSKHINRMNGVKNTLKAPVTSHICVCGKSYKYSRGLWEHKTKCNFKNSEPTLENNVIESLHNPLAEDRRDELIERLVTSDKEMKSMIHLLLEKYQESQFQIQESQLQNQESQLQYQKSQLQNQELMSKMIDVIPQIGNTTTNSHNTTNNNTLNFYLTNTCKDAESIHDFTERFVKRSVDFFKGNYLDVAHNQIDLASNVYDIFKNCLDENPQTKKFVQTTDAKNGVLYIKEKQKDENKQLCGEAEFIKHMDGFEKAGTNISHAINCAFIPVQDNYKEIMERECGKEPKEDDYEDEDHYERDMDIYKEKTGDLKRHLLVQSFNAVCLFDAKKRRSEVLEKTRRLKE
jgi:hypothetical protein